MDRQLIAAAAIATLAAGSARVERIRFADPPRPPESDFGSTELGVTDFERRRTGTELVWGRGVGLFAERLVAQHPWLADDEDEDEDEPIRMVYSGTASFYGAVRQSGDPAAPRRGHTDPVWIVEALQFVDLAEALERDEHVRGDRCRRFRFRIDLAAHRSQLEMPPYRSSTEPRLRGDAWVDEAGRIRRVTWTRINARRPRAPFQPTSDTRGWHRTELWDFGIEAKIDVPDVPDVKPDRTPWPIALAQMVWWFWRRKRAYSLPAGLVALLLASCGGGNAPKPAPQRTPAFRPSAAGWTVAAPFGGLDEDARPRLLRGADGLLVTNVDETYECNDDPRPPLRLVSPGGAAAQRGQARGTVAAATNEAGRLAALFVTLTGKTAYACGGPGILELAARRLDERIVLGRGHEIMEAVLRVDAQGNVGVAWLDRVGSHAGRVRLLAATLPAGGTLAPPRVIARGDLNPDLGPDLLDVALTSGRDGGWIVVASRTMIGYRNRIFATELARDGRVLHRETLGATRDGSTYVAAATAATGRVVVVWGAQDGGIERDKPYVVRAVRREPGAARFGEPQILDRGIRPADPFQEPSGGPLLALARDGAATLAWTRSRDRRRQPLRIATAPPGRPFGAPRARGRVAWLGGLAVRDDDAAMLVWQRREDADIEVALRPPGSATFDLVETARRTTEILVAADAAFEPRTGRPFAVVSTTMDLEAVDGDEIQLLVRRRSP